MTTTPAGLLFLLTIDCHHLGATASNCRGRDKELGLENLWPFGIYAAAVAFTIVTMIGLSSVLGQRHREPQTGTPYEGGVTTVGPIHARVGSEFYLVAAFFVVFDVETVFLFAWVLAGRSLGWNGFVALTVFVGLLASALFYLWRVGALDWNKRVRDVTELPASR